MDQTVVAFREVAERENQHRRLRRRYSPELRQQAVAYWEHRRSYDGVRSIAAALGVSVTTLQRWTRASATRPRMRPIAIVERAPAVGATSIVLTMSGDGPRVEGLTVDTAARLLTLLR